MLRNFLLSTLRSLKRYRLYSIVNISGLAIGIACSLLILLWVHRELSYDTFHKDHDRIYQVWMHARYTDELSSWRSVPLPLYQNIKGKHSAIEEVSVADWGEDHLLGNGQQKIKRMGHFVGEEFLSLFSFRTVDGLDASVYLSDPSNILLTESAARALFGEEDPIGKVVELDNESQLNVAAVLEDPPLNSSLQFDFLVAWKHYEQNSSWVGENTDNWSNYYFQVFVKLRSGDDMAEVESSLRDLLTDNGQTDAERFLFLLPLDDWHLKSSFENGKQAGGLIVYVRLFGGVALLILAIACINFMNLATARAERRAREVGVRKSIGSSRRQLVVQFLGESLLIATIAYLIAILLTELALPFYNEMLNNKLSIDYTAPEFWVLTLSVILIAGILSGSYPAFYLSSFSPVRTLKGAVFSGRNRSIPRKVMVSLQFVLSLFLLVSSLIIYQQIELVRSRELGYDTENLIMLDYTDPMHDNYSALKRELLDSRSVQSVTKTNSPVTSVNTNNFVEWPGKLPEENVLFVTLATEYDFSSTMNVKIIEGRDFSPDYPSDSMAILVNQAALDIMGLDDPIGARLEVWGDGYTLIGVFENLITGSVFQETKPMFVIFDPEWAEIMTIKLNGGTSLKESLAEVEQIVGKYNEAYPFDYKFMDDVFDQKFNAINLTQKLAGTFAILALIITGMGLFGLATYMAQRRMREMGIRKVMGASVTDLLTLINGEFVILVIVSMLISIPLTWYALDRVRGQFDRRTNIPDGVFLAAGMLLLVFTILIVSRQVYRSATLNPTVSLREE